MSHRWTRFGVRTLMLLMAMACIYLGITAHTVQRRKEASAELTQLGGQLELTGHESTLFDWLSVGNVPVKGVHYLGPQVGDENVEAIVAAASKLPELDYMTFTETRISPTGEHALKTGLPELDIKVITPILAPSSPLPQR